MLFWLALGYAYLVGVLAAGTFVARLWTIDRIDAPPVVMLVLGVIFWPLTAPVVAGLVLADRYAEAP